MQIFKKFVSSILENEFVGDKDSINEKNNQFNRTKLFLSERVRDGNTWICLAFITSLLATVGLMGYYLSIINGEWHQTFIKRLRGSEVFDDKVLTYINMHIITLINISRLCNGCLQPLGHLQRCMIPFWICLLTGILFLGILFVWLHLDKFFVLLNILITGQHREGTSS